VSQTFSMIKPDAVAAGYTGAILAHLEGAGFKILSLRMVNISARVASTFYQEHHDKPFFNDLIRFMTQGPVVVMVLEQSDAIEWLREVIGATDPAKASEGTIRSLYGTAINRNAIHASDSPEAADREIRLWQDRF
jgi:nucleoside-diphosphate kinase